MTFFFLIQKEIYLNKVSFKKYSLIEKKKKGMKKFKFKGPRPASDNFEMKNSIYCLIRSFGSFSCKSFFTSKSFCKSNFISYQYNTFKHILRNRIA